MKTILVDLSSQDDFDKVLKYGIKIAELAEAHIVGLYVEHARLAKTGLYQWGSAYSYAATGEVQEKHRKIAEDAFQEALAYTGLTHEFRYIGVQGRSPVKTLIEQCRLADILVIGAETERHDDKVTQADILGQIIAGVGRGVLIIPEDAPDNPSFGRAVIGWDGSREAARATFDALPLLKQFTMVELLALNVSTEDAEWMGRSLENISSSLRRHKISANSSILQNTLSAARVLKKQGADADLLVLGAYHHTRLRERIFGGVTAECLRAPPCPVLFSK